MIDLHSHLLPGVDDGSRSVEQSVAVLRDQGKRGVADFCLTPHLTASALEAGVPPAHDAAFAALKKAAPSSPRLHRGAEVMLDRPLSAAAAANPAFRLGGGPVMLVEFPRLVALDAVGSALRNVVEHGVVPLLAGASRTLQLLHAHGSRALARNRRPHAARCDDAAAAEPPRRPGEAAAGLRHGGRGRR
jgi:protein-tyrosine phosphatase